MIRSVDRPVNVLAGAPGLTVADLAALGVRRISLGSALARAAYGAFLQAAAELRSTGTFDFLKNAIPYPDINSKF